MGASGALQAGWTNEKGGPEGPPFLQQSLWDPCELNLTGRAISLTQLPIEMAPPSEIRLAAGAIIWVRVQASPVQIPGTAIVWNRCGMATADAG